MYVSPRWNIDGLALSISPWNEIIAIDSDEFVYPFRKAIHRSKWGMSEVRLRGGLRLVKQLGRGLSIDASGFAERVHNEAFQEGERTNAGLSVAITSRSLDSWGRFFTR
jgi:hypothetical protein